MSKLPIILSQQETIDLVMLGSNGISVLTPENKMLLDKLLGTIVSQLQFDIFEHGDNLRAAISVMSMMELRTVDELKQQAPFLFLSV